MASRTYAILAAAAFACAAMAENEPSSPEERMRLLDPLSPGELRLTPTFASCSVSYRSPVKKALRLEFRRRGAQAWSEALAAHYYPETEEYRGSIVHLEEDSAYEVRFADGDRVAAKGDFRTWRSDVPVARTVWLDSARTEFPVVVSDRGRPDGWVRYAVRGGNA